MRRKLFQLNQTQIKAIANLLLEFGKWLLLVVIFGSIFIKENEQVYSKENIFWAATLASLLIIYAIWLLRKVKGDE